MDFTGKLNGVSVDFESGKMVATFSINERHDFETAYETLKKADLLDIKCQKHREKRSIDANNYSWVLMTKIADVLHTSKEEVHEKMLQRYGQVLTDEDGNPKKIIVLAKVDVSDFGIHTKYIGHSMNDGVKFNQYLVIKGSSEYDTKEMSIYIDGIVSECKELGIQTITPNELREMKERWGV